MTPEIVWTETVAAEIADRTAAALAKRGGYLRPALAHRRLAQAHLQVMAGMIGASDARAWAQAGMLGLEGHKGFVTPCAIKGLGDGPVGRSVAESAGLVLMQGMDGLSLVGSHRELVGVHVCRMEALADAAYAWAALGAACRSLL